MSLLNPSVIVLGGSLAAAGDHLLAGVREVVYTRSLPLATAHLTIALSRSADDAGILGASILVVQHVLSADAIETALALRAWRCGPGSRPSVRAWLCGPRAAGLSLGLSLGLALGLALRASRCRSVSQSGSRPGSRPGSAEYPCPPGPTVLDSPLA